MSLHGVLRYLREVAFRLELAGDQYRQAAYSRVADGLEASGTLDRWLSIPGVGKSIQAEVETILAGSEPERLSALRSGGPPASVQEMTRISGIGARRALSLHQSGISSLAALEEAVRTHQIADPLLVRSVYAYKAARGAVPWHVAAAAVAPVQNLLDMLPVVQRHVPVGAFRRGRPDIRDVEILVDLADLQVSRKVASVIAKHIGSDITFEAGTRRARVHVTTTDEQKLPVVLDFCAAQAFGSLAVFRTGPAGFLDALRTHAAARRVALDAQMHAPDSADRCADGESYFELLGLPFIEPQHRECLRSFSSIPDYLTSADVIGDLHLLPGTGGALATPRDFSREASALGYKVVGVDTAGVLKTDASSCGVPVVRGACVEVLPAGGIRSDINLAGVRYVLLDASVQPGKDTVERVRNAAQLVLDVAPTTALAVVHPSGSHIGIRGAADVPWAEFFKMCAASNIAIGISGDPYRCDPASDVLALGARYRCRFLVGSGARTVAGMRSNMDLAVDQVNRAGLTRSDVLNMSVPALKHWLSGADLRRLG